MLYTHEMIADMGFDSVDAFVENYAKNHPNCCVRFVLGGVVCDYDFDSQPALEMDGCIQDDDVEIKHIVEICKSHGMPVAIVAPTVEEYVEALIEYGHDEATIEVIRATHTDDMLKDKVLLNGALYDTEKREPQSHYGSFDPKACDIPAHLSKYVFKADYCAGDYTNKTEK